MRVRDIMLFTQVTLRPQNSIRLVVELLKRSNLHAIPVVDEAGKLIGLFTNSNLYECLLNDISLDTAIEQYYIREVDYFREDKTFNDIGELSHWLHSVRVGQTPVVNLANEPIGMVKQVGVISVLLERTEYLYKELFSVIENVPAGILATDEKGYVTITNKYAQNILHDVQVGEHIGGFLGQLNADFESIANGAWIVPRKLEFRSLKLFATAVPIIHNTKIKGTIFVLQDLIDVEGIAHELKVVKELKTTLETVLEVAYEGVAVLDEQGNVTLANANFCKKIGKAKEQIIGVDISKFIPIAGRQSPLDVIEIDSKPCVISCLPYSSEGKTEGTVVKIYQDLDQLSDVMQQLNHLKIQLDYYRDELQKLNGTSYTIGNIISNSERIVKLKAQAIQVAQSNTTILITGESGTGKELFAHSIHNASYRRKEPFIKVNCSAIPAELAKSELFGYEDGAFTGARKDGKPGKFELANGGTIFLDEIGDMPLLLQSKLLRVIQEKELERVGGIKTRKVDVRIIAATNKDLKRLAAEGKFREDFYFRLNVIELRIPPLRERIPDIPVLVQSFIQKYNNLFSKRVEGITDSALVVLAQYSWPGNVRELENTVERILNYMGSGLIDIHDLPEEVRQVRQVSQFSAVGESRDYKEVNEVRPISEVRPVREISEVKPLKEVSGVCEIGEVEEFLGKEDLTLNTIELKAIDAALKHAKGNKSKAARLLGISRSKLYEKLAAHSRIQP